MIRRAAPVAVAAIAIALLLAGTLSRTWFHGTDGRFSIDFGLHDTPDMRHIRVWIGAGAALTASGAACAAIAGWLLRRLAQAQ